MLGPAFARWNDLRRRVTAQPGDWAEGWGYAAKSTGWGLRIRRGARTVLYMTPQEGRFLVSFALGEKAVEAAHQSTLPIAVLRTIDAAKRYAEGRGVRFEVGTAADVDSAMVLAGIKLAH